MRVDCIHATPTDRKTIVRCGLNLFGGKPHVAICEQCNQRQDTTGTGSINTPFAQSGPFAEEQTNEKAIKSNGTYAISPVEHDIAVARSKVCTTCAYSKGITLERNGRPVYSVNCGLCGCGGLSLLHGNCKADKWPSLPTEASTDTSLLLRMHLSPGDAVMLTAAVRDLHLAHPGRFVTAVDTTTPDLWENNPKVVSVSSLKPGFKRIEMHYPLVNESNEKPFHFIHGYNQFLEKQLGIPIPVSAFKGDIHLAPTETEWLNQVEETFGFKGPFWLMFAGGKYDFTAKWWSPDFYQHVVNHFMGRVQFIQCGEKHHWHPQLKGVHNLVGRTSLRQLIRLVYHAEGVVCPVTLAMHLAAAVPTKTSRLRPCVVIAGGREPPHWEAYPGHQFLHTIGALPCCATGGCWKSRCQTVGDGDIKDRQNLCERPVQISTDLRIPQCMAMIQPQDVIRAIERFLAFR